MVFLFLVKERRNQNHKMTLPCPYCNRELSDKRSLRRHLYLIHKIEQERPPLICNQCNFKSQTLLGITGHRRSRHGGKTVESVCIYCNDCFMSKDNFAQHMRNRHVLLVWDTNEATETESPSQAGPSRARKFERAGPSSRQRDSSPKPVQSAFNGGGEIYNIKPTLEIDLLTYLNSVKPEIDEILPNKTIHGAQKVQLTAELKLLKSRVDDEDKHITIFAKTDMKTVYYDGLSEKEFFTMAQQMIYVPNCFASNGSGWVL